MPFELELLFDAEAAVKKVDAHAQGTQQFYRPAPSAYRASTAARC
jgi:hypothetical protein